MELYFMFMKNKMIGIAFCSVAVGMIIITVLPKGSLGLILAAMIFGVGIYLIRRCTY